ncbi:cell wall hydrolase [Coleofasciculus sp. F4-SAH-05]|uniref:cell wall hydrolase n=1 Tax=Coleofasciculus sp. F4-SAH-05 TaxID=3069525 RepID=UPI0032FC949F
MATRPSNYFTRIADVPVHYDRLSSRDYGTRGVSTRFYATTEAERKLDQCFFELWDLCPYGKAEVITSAGTWVNKRSYHGKGRAFDLDGIFWSDRTFVTLWDGHQRGDRRFYFGVEAILRKHFGTVLNYLYDAAHRDHFHLDDGTSVGFKSVFKSRVLFLQGALVHVFGISVGSSGIDGKYGRDTKSALQQALSHLSITGNISNRSVWLQFLTGIANTAFGSDSISRREIAIVKPNSRQEFSQNENIEFEITGDSNIQTITIVSDESETVAQRESSSKWSALDAQSLKFGEKTFRIRGFDNTNRLVAESLVDIILRRSSAEDYTPPEGVVKFLGDIRYGLDKATQMSAPFVDCKIMLELEGGQFYFDSEMTVTIDGSPKAPEIDPCCGLTETLLRYPNSIGQKQYINSEDVPYIALPDNYGELGIFLGDIVAVIYDEQIEFAIFANVSRCSNKLVSGSIALLQSLLGNNDFPSDISTTGITEDVVYIIFPGSGNNTPQSPEAIRYKGRLLLKQLGGQLPGDDLVPETIRREYSDVFKQLSGQSLEKLEENIINQTLREVVLKEQETLPESLTPEITLESLANDIDILARTIYGEARGESDQGKEAVAWSVINRVNYAQARGGYWWGNTIRDVCLKPWQYSCWNRNNPNRPVILNVTASNSVFARCLKIAEDVIARRISTPVDDATHYYADYISPPFWVRSGTFVIKIGVHLFYKDVP